MAVAKNNKQAKKRPFHSHSDFAAPGSARDDGVVAVVVFNEEELKERNRSSSSGLRLT